MCIRSGWDPPPPLNILSVLSEVAMQLHGYGVDEIKNKMRNHFWSGYVAMWICCGRDPPPPPLKHSECFIWSGYAVMWIRSGWDQLRICVDTVFGSCFWVAKYSAVKPFGVYFFPCLLIIIFLSHFTIISEFAIKLFRFWSGLHLFLCRQVNMLVDGFPCLYFSY